MTKSTKILLLIASGQFRDGGFEARLLSGLAARMAGDGTVVLRDVPQTTRAAEDAADDDELQSRVDQLRATLATAQREGAEVLAVATSLGCEVLLRAVESEPWRGPALRAVLLGFVADEPRVLPAAIAEVSILCGEHDYVQYLGEDGPLAPPVPSRDHLAQTALNLVTTGTQVVTTRIVEDADHFLEPGSGEAQAAINLICDLLGQGQARGSFDRRAGLYQQSPIHSAGRSLDWLRRVVAAEAPRQVLDACCATGHATHAAVPLDASVAGVDLSPSMLRQFAENARSAGRVAWSCHRASLEALPLTTASLDLAICRLGLHHVQDPARAIAEIAQVLRPGGSLLLVEHGGAMDSADAEALDTLLRLHDRSHVTTATPAGWSDLAAPHFRPASAPTVVDEVSGLLSVEQWMTLGGTLPEDRLELRQRLDRLRTTDPGRLKTLGFRDVGDALHFDVPVQLQHLRRV